MFIGDFQSKLSKLNSKLYVHTDYATDWQGHQLCGIYLRQPKGQKRRHSKLSYEGQEKKVRQYLSDLEAGHYDRHVGGVCIDCIPEWDIWDLTRGFREVPGWRTLLLELSQKGLFKVDRARKIFNCSSLGLTDYEQAPMIYKLSLVKRLSRRL